MSSATASLFRPGTVEDSQPRSGPPPESRPRKTRIRKSRSKGLRTRNGCTACRSRHVKCSEDRPKCQGCGKGNRECVYSPTQATTVQESIASTIDTELDSTVSRTQDAFHEESAGVVTSTDETTTTTSVSAQSLPWSPQVHGQNDEHVFGASPDSTWSGSLPYSAETASLRWFGLLATDATHGFNNNLPLPHQEVTASTYGAAPTETSVYVSQDEVSLRDDELPLFQHFVQHISPWIDLTDPDKSFAILVPQMALRNLGLMNAILALSSRHLSLTTRYAETDPHQSSDRTQAVNYYNTTLVYLQQVMSIVSYLRSDELLATVLIISTYEMIDGSDRGWERHLKGVFWIQRSQLIHGESHGIKKWIWWAWLRQDIWAAFRERRKILSYYTLTRACKDLNFWELVNRAVFLLGQCVNYASDGEAEAGRNNVMDRVQQAQALLTSLEEWRGYFNPYDRRLPAPRHAETPFVPIWINPPSASVAVQVHHFSKLILLEHMPAINGLKELSSRASSAQEPVNTICGIALCTTETAAMIVSTQCLFAAGMHVRHEFERDHIVKLLNSHQRNTSWPHYDLGAELRASWRAS